MLFQKHVNKIKVLLTKGKYTILLLKYFCLGIQVFAFHKMASLFIALAVAGCSVMETSLTRYELKEPDPSKGIVVGTVMERSSQFKDGLEFVIWGPREKEIMRVTNWMSRSPSNFAEAKGMGHAFALQLAPGKYRVANWSLPDGKGFKSSAVLKPDLEFEVVAGKVFYLGRFDASQILEVAAIYDNLQGDLPALRKIPGVNVELIENKSLSKRGWWMNEATGKANWERMGKLRCDLC